MQPTIDLLELVSGRSLDLWNEIRTFPKEMIFKRLLEPRSFEDKEINELVKKLQFYLCFLIIDRASYRDIFCNLVPELEKKIDELKNENIKIKTENTKLKHDKEEVEIENIKLKQDLDEFKKELESKKNRKFQEKCILITQILLNEEPIVEYRPSFMGGLELDAFFRINRIALEVQGAQHRFHSASWYKDVKKLEDIVDRDRKKRTLCQLNGIYLLEVWYDENPEITIPKKIYKFREFIDRKTFNLD
ncbi:2027_t:CDS:1 [Racocetra fulgida]|uniref:2027_t:CDS:1 n=1 Tax=Racocetra fulgida TaxID=60492 RepID=A0A9N9DLY5_9GLOM|nr:2027_t:CDS:1 [Racocetra fulgida]